MLCQWPSVIYAFESNGPTENHPEFVSSVIRFTSTESKHSLFEYSCELM